MAGIKETFSKGLTIIDVKTNNFVEQNKIKTNISTMEKQANDLKFEAGKILYEQWCQGVKDISAAEETFQAIKRKYEEVEEQKKKIEQIQEAEKQVFESTPQTSAPVAPTPAPQPTPQAGSQPMPQPTAQAAPQPNAAGNAPRIFCSQCGAPNNAAYKFCIKCGKPLE